MDYFEPPRLGPIDVAPVTVEGRNLLALFDPSGLHRNAVLVGPEALRLLSLMDGSRDAKAILGTAAVRFGLQVEEAELGEMLSELGKAGFLEGPHLERMRTEANREYRQRAARRAAFAGQAYPEEKTELLRWLDDTLREPEDVPENISTLVLPHIDISRAPECYGAARAVLKGSPADLYIMLGIGHHLVRAPMCFSQVPFETPLGEIAVDRKAMATLEETLGGLPGEDEEYVHAGEHSLEFASLLLGSSAPGAVTPAGVFILLGGLFGPGGMDEEKVEWFDRLAEGVRRAKAEAERDGRRVMVMAAADLSHLGVKFGGDPIRPEDALDDLKEADLGELDLLLEEGAERFLETYREHSDARNVCGAPALYVARKAAGEAEGGVLAYEQAREPETLSVVSAAAAWMRPRG